MKHGGDDRFANVRNKPLKFLVFWLIQGVWVFITMLPSLLVLTTASQPRISVYDYVGLSLYAFGFLFEATADTQKTRFNSNPANRGRFISSGLWSLSRHPNVSLCVCVCVCVWCVCFRV